MRSVSRPPVSYIWERKLWWDWSSRLSQQQMETSRQWLKRKCHTTTLKVKAPSDTYFWQVIQTPSAQHSRLQQREAWGELDPTVKSQEGAVPRVELLFPPLTWSISTLKLCWLVISAQHVYWYDLSAKGQSKFCQLGRSCGKHPCHHISTLISTTLTKAGTNLL